MLKRSVLLVLASILLGCPKPVPVPTPTPPAPTPTPSTCADLTCVPGYVCTETAEGPVCVPAPTPTPEPACIPNAEDETMWEVAPYRDTKLYPEYDGVVAAVGDRCGYASPSEVEQHQTLELIAAEWRRRGRCAQHVADSVTVLADDGLYEEFHAVYFATGCIIQRPFKNAWRYKGNAAPVDPMPPKVGKFGGPKPHNKWNDTTPKFYNKTAERWDGSTVEGYCSMVFPGYVDLWCPCRAEGDPLRLPCERYGVSGKADGAPLWRSDGAVEVSADNIFFARCSNCTYIEVCAADGTQCSRCAISPTTGLCKTP